MKKIKSSNLPVSYDENVHTNKITGQIKKKDYTQFLGGNDESIM